MSNNCITKAESLAINVKPRCQLITRDLSTAKVSEPVRPILGGFGLKPCNKESVKSFKSFPATQCITFELTPDGIKPLAKKVKLKVPRSTSRFTIELYSSVRTDQSKVQP
ncbi:MAG: hypothetical protein PHV02_00225 [Rhodocyclaceae bacterium]|nr:hypothetical protein [Rhodocyclaceae bacterium]